MNKFYNTLISLKVGDRIVVPKSHLDLIQHHAIFLGYEKGHYWFIENKEGIGVRIVNATTFLYDVLKITRIVPFIPKVGYSRNDLVKNALSKVGKRYELTKYNCEHLASELQHKVVRSVQADTGVFIAAATTVLLIVGALVSTSNNNFKTT